MLKYQEVSDIIPYYCEALFHLEIMFKSGFIKLEDKVSLDFSNYEKLKKTYMEFYDELVKIYLDRFSYESDYVLKGSVEKVIESLKKSALLV
ncbi:MAG TPA: hypothetical protein EYP16_06345, partial [Candidatus Atribacteria bacterium]|nr:hypothetical protein [Candidatus Atribacteria bacterium]